mmetsp:Transcript_63313/g.176126  ORF Transcript_63313/g.176126 Transcript_63313/m.176126 type:complete len:206 (-) Transcript_63313:3301-3918(-)
MVPWFPEMLIKPSLPSLSAFAFTREMPTVSSFPGSSNASTISPASSLRRVFPPFRTKESVMDTCVVTAYRMRNCSAKLCSVSTSVPSASIFLNAAFCCSSLKKASLCSSSSRSFVTNAINWASLSCSVFSLIAWNNSCTVILAFFLCGLRRSSMMCVKKIMAVKLSGLSDVRIAAVSRVSSSFFSTFSIVSFATVRSCCATNLCS